MLLGGSEKGYLRSMAQEANYYTAHEAARVLGLSPARVRQMLRAGELEEERGGRGSGLDPGEDCSGGKHPGWCRKWC